MTWRNLTDQHEWYRSQPNRKTCYKCHNRDTTQQNRAGIETNPNKQVRDDGTGDRGLQKALTAEALDKEDGWERHEHVYDGNS